MCQSKSDQSSKRAASAHRGAGDDHLFLQKGWLHVKSSQVQKQLMWQVIVGGSERDRAIVGEKGDRGAKNVEIMPRRLFW